MKTFRSFFLVVPATLPRTSLDVATAWPLPTAPGGEDFGDDESLLLHPLAASARVTSRATAKALDRLETA
jgi:hypothetical protein